jgi:hypothetical protein
MLTRPEIIKMVKAFNLDIRELEFNVEMFEVVAQASHDNVVQSLMKLKKATRSRIKH